MPFMPSATVLQEFALASAFGMLLQAPIVVYHALATLTGGRGAGGRVPARRAHLLTKKTEEAIGTQNKKRKWGAARRGRAGPGHTDVGGSLPQA